MLVLTLVALLLAAPVAAQTVEVEVDTVCFMSGCLEPDEMEVYRAAKSEIERRLPHSGEPSALLAVVEELLFWIDELPLQERARDDLRRYVGGLALEDEPPGGARFYVLLASDDPDIQSFALGRLFAEAEHDLLGDDRLVGALLELLDDPGADLYLRTSVLWLFQHEEAFDVVAERARLLASDPDPELAHRAAQAVVAEAEERPGAVEHLYRSSEGPLRQWSALSLEGTVDELRAMAIDPNLPPWVRGRAIEEVGMYAERPQNRAILLELLEPEHRFFGAEGAHFHIHSLAVVIDALEDIADDPAIRKTLSDLYPAVAELRTGEREYVEWTLDNALGIDRPVFHGPVDPEKQP